MKDFYLTEKGLAQYVEAEWLDKVAPGDELQSKCKAVPRSFIQSEYCTVAPGFIVSCLAESGVSPKTLLEVGPAVGRVNYELVSSLDQLQQIHIIEPSKLLLDSFKDILLTQGVSTYRHVSAVENSQFSFDTSPLAAKYSGLLVETYNEPATHELNAPACDLVVCLNVLDQSESPEQIVSFLMSKVHPGGVLALSCTYQWSKKHLKNPKEKITDIYQYFGQDWKQLGEKDIEYRFRVNERYSMLFLSHTVVYKRT